MVAPDIYLQSSTPNNTGTSLNPAFNVNFNAVSSYTLTGNYDSTFGGDDRGYTSDYASNAPVGSFVNDADNGTFT